MKTKTFKISVIIFATLFFSVSCSDFLDTEPKGVTSSEDFYKTDEQAYEGILACYDIMQSLNAYSWNSLWMLKVLQSDELIAGGGGRGDQPPYEEINEFTYGPSNPVITWVFDKLYYGVYRANKVIELVEPDTPAKTAIVAEAKAFRALYYFELVTLWGKVPLVLTELNPSEYAQPFAEINDIWAQIETDLTEAIPDLPRKSEYSAADKFRISKGTAQALLGKAYLFQNKFSEAAVQFQLVINSHEYSRIADFSRITRKDTEFGNESLLEVSYSEAKGYDWGNFDWGNDGRNVESNIHWQLANPRGDGYFNGGTTGMVPGWGFCYPEPAMNQLFITHGDSVRRAGTLMSEDELIAAGGGLRLNGVLPWGCAGFVRVKYAAFATESGEPITELNYGMNLRLIRYADVLLMGAEALNRQPSPDDATARAYINEVRSITNLAPLTSESGNTLFEIIKTERQLELMFEGHRFLDLKRWGMAQSVLGTKRTGGAAGYPGRGGYTAKNAYLPIPENERLVNPYTPDDGY